MTIWLEGSVSQQNVVVAMFNCKLGSFPITYLGLPLRPGSLLKTDWQPIIDRVEKKINYLERYWFS